MTNFVLSLRMLAWMLLAAIGTLASTSLVLLMLFCPGTLPPPAWQAPRTQWALISERPKRWRGRADARDRRIEVRDTTTGQPATRWFRAGRPRPD